MKIFIEQLFLVKMLQVSLFSYFFPVSSTIYNLFAMLHIRVRGWAWLYKKYKPKSCILAVLEFVHFLMPSKRSVFTIY